jgi:hypothetical protein
MYPANSYSIRHATDLDKPTLRHLADLDSQKTPAGPALIAERDGIVVAAISASDERVLADPFEHTAVVAQLLRMRLRALRAHSETPSLPERLRGAMRPFVARTATG